METSRFSQRNVYYLRASPYCVLQMVLYVDQPDLRWINAHPDIFDRVLEVLRPRLMPKLVKEAGPDGQLGTLSKKETIEAVAEADFNLCFFFRKVERKHGVLLKEKSLVFPEIPERVPVVPRAGTATPANGPIPRQSERSWQRSQSRALATPAPAGPNEPLKPPSPPQVEEAMDVSSGEEDEEEVRQRQQSQLDAHIKEEEDEYAPTYESRFDHEGVGQQPEWDLDMDNDDEDKPKPRLHVKYAGFRILGKMLVVIIEPSSRSRKRAPHLFTTELLIEQRQLSATPGPGGPRSRRGRSSSTALDDGETAGAGGNFRDATPLFRGMTPASEVEWERTPTPEPSVARARMERPPVPRFSESPSVSGDADRGETPAIDVDAQVVEVEEDVGETQAFSLATQLLSQQGQGHSGADFEIE